MARIAASILGPDAAVSLEYRGGWDRDRPLAEALAMARARDREQYGTSVGPHRADLVIRLAGRDVRQRVSRGQQKLLAYARRLAQAEQLGGGASGGCALLLDDLPAELDRSHRAAVMRVAAEVGAQLLVTALEPEAVDRPPGMARKVFHVERGTVREVVQ